MKRIVRTAKILFDFSVLSMKSVSLKISIVSFDSSYFNHLVDMIFDIIKVQSKVLCRELLDIFTQIHYDTFQWNDYPPERSYFSP